MKRGNLAGILFVVMIAFLSGCASQKGLTRHDGDGLKAEEYGTHTALEVEAIARKVLMSSLKEGSVSTSCPPNATVNISQRKGYLHLGRNPVDPERGYLHGPESVVRLSKDVSLRVEQHGGKWVTGVVPKGTVLVANLTGEILRICSCGNGVTLPDGKPAYVDLPKPTSNLAVETLLPEGVTSGEAVLLGEVSFSSEKGETLAWPVYRKDGSSNFFAAEPQFVSEGKPIARFYLVGLDPNKRYYYQMMAANAFNKAEGNTIWFVTDKKCLGAGTVASFTGPAAAILAATKVINPYVGYSLALGSIIYSALDEESSPTCKTIAGGAGIVAAGIYSLSLPSSTSSSGSPGPGPSPPTGPGPNPPNGPAPNPGN